MPCRRLRYMYIHKHARASTLSLVFLSLSPPRHRPPAAPGARRPLAPALPRGRRGARRPGRRPALGLCRRCCRLLLRHDLFLVHLLLLLLDSDRLIAAALRCLDATVGPRKPSRSYASPCHRRRVGEDGRGSGSGGACALPGSRAPRKRRAAAVDVGGGHRRGR